MTEVNVEMWSKVADLDVAKSSDWDQVVASCASADHLAVAFERTVYVFKAPGFERVKTLSFTAKVTNAWWSSDSLMVSTGPQPGSFSVICHKAAQQFSPAPLLPRLAALCKPEEVVHAGHDWLVFRENSNNYGFCSLRHQIHNDLAEKPQKPQEDEDYTNEGLKDDDEPDEQLINEWDMTRNAFKYLGIKHYMLEFMEIAEFLEDNDIPFRLPPEEEPYIRCDGEDAAAEEEVVETRKCFWPATASCDTHMAAMFSWETPQNPRDGLGVVMVLSHEQTDHDNDNQLEFVKFCNGRWLHTTTDHEIERGELCFCPGLLVVSWGKPGVPLQIYRLPTPTNDSLEYIQAIAVDSCENSFMRSPRLAPTCSYLCVFVTEMKKYEGFSPDKLDTELFGKKCLGSSGGSLGASYTFISCKAYALAELGKREEPKLATSKVVFAHPCAEAGGTASKRDFVLTGNEVWRIAANSTVGVSVDYVLSKEFEDLAISRTKGKCKVENDPTFIEMSELFWMNTKTAIGFSKKCPVDGQNGCALLDHINPKYRGTCTHFLSWTWHYRLSTVTDALTKWVSESGLRAEDVFLYMCFFCNNQYRIYSEEAAGGNDLEKLFESRLTAIGKVVALLDTWDAPQYLTRVWTIYEQYTAARLDVEMKFILPKDASRSLVEAFEEGKKGILKVRTSVTNVKVESAKATFPADEEKIKALIQNGPLGFHGVNEKVRGTMITWIVGEVDKHLRKLVVEGDEATEPRCDSQLRKRLDEAVQLDVDVTTSGVSTAELKMIRDLEQDIVSKVRELAALSSRVLHKTAPQP